MKLNTDKLNQKLYPQFKQGGILKAQEGGLLERKGAPFVTPKPIQPEFPYNGQSMYKGGYNLKRALELYKPDNKQDIINKIITVRHNGIISNVAGAYSLYLPRLIEVRVDKIEADTLQKIQNEGKRI